MVTLDAVVTDEAELTARLEALLGGTVTAMEVRSTDLVRDSMLVDVRYRLLARAPSGQPVPKVPAVYDGASVAVVGG